MQCGQPALPYILLPAVVARKAREGHHPFCAKHHAEAKHQGKARKEDRERRKAAKRQDHQRRRDERLARGLCVECGERPHDEGAQRCRPCKMFRNTSTKRRRDQRQADGLCVGCAVQLDEFDDSRLVAGKRKMYRKCRKCRLKHADALAARKARLRRGAGFR